jgi:ubiquinone/menaquinone biosynthesis C-methylase UbiE
MNSMTPEMESLKARIKATWMTGDYGLVAKTLEPSAQAFMTRLAVPRGARVLDVACGSGNLAIEAARMGAVATGVDIAPNLLEQARERARSEGLAIQFDEGDAEELPYPDGTFDVVVSMFGVMFAPRPALATSELARVCRSGGRIALANWTPEGFGGALFKAIGRHVPPPPGISPPLQWGDESIVRERLRDGIADLQLSRRTCAITYPFAPREVVEFFRTYFGPVNRAFSALDEAGRSELRQDLEEVWSTHNQARDGSTHVDGEYLEIVARRS